MAEAAYRTSVLAGGKKQKSLTTGWEVLGLSKEAATRIFELEAKEGFLSERQKMYGGQSTKYDKRGNIINKEGEIIFKQGQDAPDDEEEDDAPTSNVYECSECGYTLFIAKGREFKFFGDSFECPECGAAKDKFEPRTIDVE
jgi:rubredoxin